MERREQERRSRRVQVKFTVRGADKVYRGYSANISTGGMYIDSNHPLAKGTRIRLEVCAGEKGFMVEAEVARVIKSRQAMRPSGMGVRFLSVDELVDELMPRIDTLKDSGPAAADGVYRLRFSSREQFFEVYDRDLATGGLFIPTDDPAPISELVMIELSVDAPGVEPVRFPARVVHRLDPKMPEGTTGGNLMAGMGVEIQSFDTTLKAIWTMVAQLKQSEGAG
ncbi:MAG: PilZ domain-containing protein [Acidobacteriota bacterium]